MSKRFRRYEMLLPLRFNDGRPVSSELIEESLLELRERFAESCETQTTRGTWRHDDQFYRDELVRMYVDVADTAENRAAVRHDILHFSARVLAIVADQGWWFPCDRLLCVPRAP
ncbi:MAG: hypothetical protein EXS05_02810 [Planctomycetaceae bacterium]|nr:hypothetical protein [Planctomycetaceae bacterium]